MFLLPKYNICFYMFLSLISTFSNALQSQEIYADQPIKIILNDWSSQLVLSHITANIFRELGFSVEFIKKSSDAQWGALQRGLGHVQVEVWQGTMEKKYQRVLAKGRIIDAGEHDAKTREDWWYPLHVEALCPGLPDWRALKRCSAIFATKDTASKGQYVGGPWEKYDAARIRSLGLDFRILQTKSSGELWDMLKKAIKHKQPIVLFNWTPNWVEAKYKGKFIEFPPYHADCENKPEWGENKKFLHDCGNPINGWLKKIAWSRFSEVWPCAYTTLKNINFNNEMLAGLALEVDMKGNNYQKVADNWLKENETLWQAWIPASCKLNKEAVL